MAVFLVHGLDQYEIDPAFLRGCEDCINGVPYSCNPFRNEIKRDQWHYGHAIQSALPNEFRLIYNSP